MTHDRPVPAPRDQSWSDATDESVRRIALMCLVFVLLIGAIAVGAKVLLKLRNTRTVVVAPATLPVHVEESTADAVPIAPVVVLTPSGPEAAPKSVAPPAPRRSVRRRVRRAPDPVQPPVPAGARELFDPWAGE